MRRTVSSQNVMSPNGNSSGANKKFQRADCCVYDLRDLKWFKWLRCLKWFRWFKWYIVPTRKSDDQTRHVNHAKSRKSSLWPRPKTVKITSLRCTNPRDLLQKQKQKWSYDKKKTQCDKKNTSYSNGKQPVFFRIFFWSKRRGVKNRFRNQF